MVCRVLCVALSSVACGAAPPATLVLERNAEAHCLATLISPRWAITAKHCVQEMGEERPSSAQELRLRSRCATHPVLEVVVLGGAYSGVAGLHGRDLALLRLADGDRCLHPAALGSATMPGTRHTALGGDRLAPTTVRFLGPTVLISDGLTCGGDSGGGLFDRERALVGVTSWRTAGACGAGRSIFTRVDAHRPWIDRTLAKNQGPIAAAELSPR